MPKPDYGHQMTEKELAALEKRIAKVYREARDELDDTIKSYFESFRKRDEDMKKRVESGEVTEEHYKQWRLNQIGRGKRFEDLRGKIAERYTKANETALAYVNDETPSIYSLNRNYAAYTIEQVAGNVGFTLWDESTVRRLILESPDLMPFYPEAKALKRGIDLAWGKSQITKAVTSGILQGKSIGNLAKDLQTRIPAMNRASAVRAARTAITGAQNAGRMDSFEAAAKMGIQVRKRWVATKDNRTRHSHQTLDGRTVDYDKPFVSDLGSEMMFPGDPHGAKPGDLYNCRCTMRTVEKEGMEAEPRKMRVRDPKTGKNVLVNEMTYPEWEGWKKTGKSDIIKETVKPMQYRRFDSGEQVNDFFYYDGEERGALQKARSEHGRWLRGLSKNEELSISSYAANGYSDINRYLRRDKGWESIPADMVEDASKQIDSAISRFHLKENITVQRGLDDFYGSSLVESKEWNDIHEIVGMTYQDLGYGSSTALIGNRVAVAKPYLLEIEIPSGTGRGAYINRLAGQYEDKEYEFLIARGSRFEITGVEINEESIPPQTVIRMRLIADE